MEALPKPSSLTKQLMDEGPFAFPFEHHDALCPGMTLRDYFAAKAFGGMATAVDQDRTVYWDEIARDAYKAADAMLAERAK